MRFIGVYEDTKGQDSVEYIAASIVFVAICAIVYWTVFPKVESKAHTIEFTWSGDSP